MKGGGRGGAEFVSGYSDLSGKRGKKKRIEVEILARRKPVP